MAVVKYGPIEATARFWLDEATGAIDFEVKVDGDELAEGTLGKAFRAEWAKWLRTQKPSEVQ